RRALLLRPMEATGELPAQQMAKQPFHDSRQPRSRQPLRGFELTHSYEIAFRSWNGVELVDRPGWPKNFYPYLPTPPVVGDVDGDGQEEIIIGTYDPARVHSDGALLIYSLDGTLKMILPVPGGLKHIPT